MNMLGITDPQPLENAPNMTAEAAGNLTPEEQQRGQRCLIQLGTVFGCTSALVWGVSSLFLLSLGATPFHLGLLETLMRLAVTVRLAAARLVAVAGKRRAMLIGRAGMSLPLALLILVASRDTDRGDTTLWMGVATYALLVLFNHLGNTSWWPLLQDNTNRSDLASFLSRLRIRQRSIELVLPLLVGWYLGTHPSSQRFALLFALGLVANLLIVLLVRRVSEAPRTHQQPGHVRRLMALAQLPAMRRYELFAACNGFVIAAILPFWVVALTRAGMGAIYFVWMTSVGALGYVLALHGWGRLVDTWGTRVPLTLALLAKATLGLMWLALPVEPTAVILWATVLFFLWGVLESGANLGQNRAMVDAVSSEFQAEGFALAITAAAIGGAAGGLMGGLAVQQLSDVDGARWAPLHLYLCGGQLALIGVWFLSRFLNGYRDEPTLAVAAKRLWRATTRRRAPAED